MDFEHKNLNYFFDKIFEDLQCQKTTKAYIVSIFAKYKDAKFDFSNESITLLYAQAKYNQDFLLFQSIADYIFFSKTYAPNHLNNASEDYYRNLGRLSYYSCYNLIKKQWSLYEEMSDNFVALENQTKIILRKELKI